MKTAQENEWIAEFKAAAFSFRQAETRDFPVCHPDDIIRSKEKANRVKDRESLPRLKAFRDYWKSKK